MGKLLNEQAKNQISLMLNIMIKPVKYILFIEENCNVCGETKQLLEEFVEVSELLTLEVFDKNEETLRAQEYNVERVPALILLDDKDIYRGVKFYGTPAGHEINSLIMSTIDMSKGKTQVSEKILNRIRTIDKPTNIKVFVTLGCPHCPGAVHKAHQLAMLNPNIEAEMIDAQAFSSLSSKFDVMSVPMIVINNEHSFVGNQPLDVFVSEIESYA